ncbi:hypothetical protein QR685DRAFT_573937 [Neurospora intermedia]|uniref:Uncharacterized protein n=1 Tax=Neurospora intermedia TaxID=5142 RepID=A0ABR3D6C1_NEUIN
MLVAPCSLTAARNVTSTSPTDEGVQYNQNAVATVIAVLQPYFASSGIYRLGFIDQGTYCLALHAFHHQTIGQHRNGLIFADGQQAEMRCRLRNCKRNFKGRHHREVAWKVGHANQQQKSLQVPWPRVDTAATERHATSGYVTHITHRASLT